jgi:hypothetical protein
MAPRRTDRILLLEVLMVLLLIALSVTLFWQPAAAGLASPQWWHWTVLAALFFGVIGLDRWRRRRRVYADLHEVIREDSPRGAE